MKTPSLDIHASSSSPPLTKLNSQAGNGSLAQTKDMPVQANDNSIQHHGKSLRHGLRRTAGKLMKKERVACCGQRAVGNLVSLHQQGAQAHFGSVETCGSVWMCPVCAAKITEGRRDELDSLLDAHRAAGGEVYMATLTIPHHRFQSCKDLKWAVSRAWGKVKTGKGWQTARDNSGWIGDVRALEITHGSNGWHPHLHVLVFFKVGATKGQMEAYGDWLFGRWSKAVDRLGFGSCSRNAFTYERVNADKGAADYMGKWGVAMEMTKAHTKKSKEGRTPWQILQDYQGHKDHKDAQLFIEYAFAFKGSRQLTWSQSFTRKNGAEEPSLRNRYLDEPETTDEKLAETTVMAETQVASVTRPLFKVIADKAMTASILEAQERGGLPAVQSLLTTRGIPWSISEIPGLLEGTFVPLISLGNSRGHSPKPT